MLRRLDCVLSPTKQTVLGVDARFKGRLDNPDRQLRRASGFAFYNTSRYDFEKLLADAPHIAQNLRNYIAGFSPNLREVLEKFDFDNTISKLDEAGLLFLLVQRGPGLPRISEGQLLFLLHMLAHVKDPAQGGSRVAIIMNGSPLFTGDAGSGDSEIRRWILENDLLEALIALPELFFYNTGIATYVWVLTNLKRPGRHGLVQLVDATAFWVLLRNTHAVARFL